MPCVLLGLAAVLITRRSVVAQVMARGVAWAVALPPLILSLLFASSHLPSSFVAMSSAAVLLALALARPMLHTEEAKRAFNPVAFRSLLLAGGISAVAVGADTGQLGRAFQAIGSVGFGTVLLALGVSSLAAGIGIAKMRAWGMILGMATSMTSLVMMFAHLRGPHGSTMPWLFAPSLVPGALMGSVLGLARLLPPPNAAMQRIASDEPRVRVAMALSSYPPEDEATRLVCPARRMQR